jgi:taurine dioxygenase
MDVRRLSARLGATVTGLDLDQLAAPETVAALRAAWAEHLVLIMPELNPTPAQHVALGQVFGTVDAPRSSSGTGAGYNSGVAPGRLERLSDQPEVVVVDSAVYSFDYWHTDNSFQDDPPIGTMLVARTMPAFGGDTMWASTRAAHETLAPPLQQLCEGLQARHGRANYGTEHPVVAVHPVHRSRHLFLNRGWTRSIVGLARHESDALLELLLGHIERPEHTVRWSWSVGDVVIWDNRATNHYAIRDHTDARVMHRVTITS